MVPDIYNSCKYLEFAFFSASPTTVITVLLILINPSMLYKDVQRTSKVVDRIRIIRCLLITVKLKTLIVFFNMKNIQEKIMLF